jgi:uncharacterized protein YndB with AHSA1/START domain
MLGGNESELSVKLPSDREISFIRFFAHDHKRLFDAWTQPEHIRHWWGCDGAIVMACEIDLREEGAWRIMGRMPGSGDQTFTGVYKTIIPGRQLVYSECYQAPQFGNPSWQTTVMFDDINNGTQLTHTILHVSRDVRDMHLKVGMDKGEAQSLARLQAHLDAKQLATRQTLTASQMS